MITPSFGLTATERVLPRLALDWTTGLAQSGVDVVRAGVATFVGSNGLIQSATADTQRVDWSAGTPGLLVEESRTNFFTYSEDFTNAVWTNTNTTESSNVAVAPDGNTTADKIIEAVGAKSTFAINRGGAGVFSVTAGTTYTFSYFVKAAGRSFIAIQLLAGFGTPYACFNLTNGTVGTVSGSITPSIKPYKDGWYRVSVTATATSTTASGTQAFYICNADNSFSYTGDGVSGVFLFGAQGEIGAFATSYTPTEATAVTRNADVATMTGTNFSDWFNPTEGTFAATFLTFSSAEPNTIIHAGTNSNFNDRIALLTTPSNFVVANSAGVNQATLGSVSRLNVESTMIGAYKENDFAWAVDGNTPSTDASGVTPSPVAFCLGYRNTASPNLFLNGLLRKVSYWPQRLTNNEVQAFSKG